MEFKEDIDDTRRKRSIERWVHLWWGAKDCFSQATQSKTERIGSDIERIYFKY